MQSTEPQCGPGGEERGEAVEEEEEGEEEEEEGVMEQGGACSSSSSQSSSLPPLRLWAHTSTGKVTLRAQTYCTRLPLLSSDSLPVHQDSR